MSDTIKVLFLTYPRIGINRGGLQIQIEKTAEELMKIGVEVIRYNPWKNEIATVDLIHVFSLDGTLLWHVEKAAQLGKPVVTTPIFSSFTHPPWLVALKVRLSTHIPGMYTDLNRAKFILSSSDRILPLNEQEKYLMLNSFNLPDFKFEIVPNGINPAFVAGNRELFYAKYGEVDFVIQVGSIDKNKNHLNTIKALSKLPYKLFIIGQASHENQEYLNKCKAVAGDNVIFVGQLAYEDPLLASAFAAAKLFVLPSYSEVMPLTLYEAATAGCGIVVSKTFPIDPSLAGFVTTVDPDSPESIARAIKKEMTLPVNPALRQAALLMPSWPDIAIKIKAIYENTLSLRS